MSPNVTELRWLSQPKWPSDLKRNAFLKRKTGWLWHGYLAERTSSTCSLQSLILNGIIAAAHDKLTLSQIRRDWPHNQPRPGKVTLWRWLERAVETGQLRRTGAGRKKCPYRYWSPDRAQSWRQNPEHAERLDVDDEWERIMAGLRLRGADTNGV